MLLVGRYLKFVVLALLAVALVVPLLELFGPVGWLAGQLYRRPTLLSDACASSAPVVSEAPAGATRCTQEEYHDPPFVKVDELLDGTTHYSPQRRPATGCPPVAAGRLCRLEDVFDEIFVISLPRATDRLARVRAQLRALGVPYTLVHAVDGRLMASSAELAKNVLVNPVDQHPGVLGLYLTHLGLLDYVTRSAGLERVLILEDDVTFCADFPRAFDARMRRMPSDWRMLWLGALVFTPTYQNPEALDHFVDVGFARPTHVMTSFALGLHREAAAFVAEKMLASREAIDEHPYNEALHLWPNQTFIVWPPVAMTDPYSGSTIGHGWWPPPAVWAHDNGLDLSNFDLARGYHVGGELGSDLRCVVVADGPTAISDEDNSDDDDDDEVATEAENPKGFFVGQAEVVNSSAECCAKCSRDFPWCRAWRWYTHTHRCVLDSGAEAARVPSAKRAVSGRMVQEDSVPLVPNVVHFFPPLHDATTTPRLDVWSYLSVLSAAINTEPDHIRWHHRSIGGSGSKPEGPWWDECALPLISSLHQVPSAKTNLNAADREEEMRLGVLIDEGGILLDTDALVVRSFAPLRARQAVTLARDGLDRKLAGVGVVVAPRNGSFLHRWLAKVRDQSAEQDYRAGAVALQLAEQHADEAQLLSHAAFYPRSSSPHHLKVAYQADDCASEHESFSVHRHSSAAWASSSAPPAPATGGGKESAAGELERVWLGKGSLHRVARAIVRKALAGGRLCAMAEREVRRLEARGEAPACPPAIEMRS
ncbi:LPS glycosyltransferase subfamily protein [Acanthamoeba castellanii str. Neff]|uniref:LPS glycosyltransferase subfamily protein n=1 Tax=Acanthamoeba castellanii (strain ATCC 30010 / Neff) TaxID=1257118 RepID=L8GW54_ACACF|nr:LPS glycosyltransferase subfamily protein [Acanthamoeba castellanii str. Neff]ELR17235.1 LPS glycosyltransferase subfamily protein [Acanthamoeba castellanii str. Neff]